MYVSTQGQSIDLTKVYNAVKLGRYARLYSLSRQVSQLSLIDPRDGIVL